MTRANISLKPKAIEQLTHSLSVVLANTYLLYVKTQNFHWNVIDPRFYSLHKMLEEQYEGLAEAVDIIAERIRMLGNKSPASMEEFLELTTLKETSKQISGDEMLKQLLYDHEAIIKMLREKIDEAAEFEDQGTQDMYIQRLREHEKTAWMLRAHFKA